jgi:predicted HicB family RNase H-like nuclease
MAARTVKSRSARARGLRTLQHQTLPAATYYGIDTEVWFRTLIVEASQEAHDPRWATKDQVYDEALAWFLEHRIEGPAEPRAARRVSDEDLTFWIDSKLMERARRLAVQQGIRLAQLIETALSAYVRAHVPEELAAFRRRVQQEAGSLYARRRGAVPAGAKTAPGPARSQRGRLRR